MVNPVRLPKPEADLLLLRIELKYIEPTIWRRVAVPENITLGRLHSVIQIVMGWEGGHLHEFEIAGERGSSARCSARIWDKPEDGVSGDTPRKIAVGGSRGVMCVLPTSGALPNQAKIIARVKLNVV